MFLCRKKQTIWERHSDMVKRDFASRPVTTHFIISFKLWWSLYSYFLFSFSPSWRSPVKTVNMVIIISALNVLKDFEIRVTWHKNRQLHMFWHWSANVFYGTEGPRIQEVCGLWGLSQNSSKRLFECTLLSLVSGYKEIISAAMNYLIQINCVYEFWVHLHNTGQA